VILFRRNNGKFAKSDAFGSLELNERVSTGGRGMAGAVVGVQVPVATPLTTIQLGKKGQDFSTTIMDVSSLDMFFTTLPIDVVSPDRHWNAKEMRMDEKIPTEPS
jgi:hypothetical protein